MVFSLLGLHSGFSFILSAFPFTFVFYMYRQLVALLSFLFLCVCVCVCVCVCFMRSFSPLSPFYMSCIDICLVLFVFQSAFLLSLAVVIDLYLLVDMIYLIGDYSSVWLTRQALFSFKWCLDCLNDQGSWWLSNLFS